ncbi:MFS transporter [Skermania sp. ID1734]|uniref:MFS transporter n=1 Tax=Skermania sp. ID1734 TaxID=2597516 RepID=UPI00117D0314|nr:MFS transporter [Skermania sp. ID1734]TSE00628.1 MFS transporter [Skermania sp. ID1734]
MTITQQLERTQPDIKWWTLGAVCTGVFMLLLDITIVNVALPDIQNQFDATLSGLQWVIDAYALTLAAFLLTSGTIADQIGRRKVFAAGLVIFTCASLLCGLSTGVTMLALARALQGVGGAIMFATSLALLAQAFPPKERGVAFGVFGAVTGVAVAVGPVLGGALTSWLSWRWIFFVNLPIGIVALAVTLLRVRESRDPARRPVDWAGCVTFSVALAALVFGLIRSHADGWTSATVLGSFVAAAVLLIAFIAIEWTGRAPMFDLHLLRVPTFNGGLLAAWGISASLFSLLTYLVIYLQGVMGYSAIEVGVRVLPMTLAIFVTAGIAGRLSNLVPVRWLIGPGFLLVGAGLLLMRGSDPTAGWMHFLPGFIVAGAGAGLINVPLASTAVGVVTQERAGMASGINSTFRQIGIATGVAALGSILAARLKDSVVASLAGTPVGTHAQAIADAVSNGQTKAALGGVPPQLRGVVGQAAAHGYASALDTILLIGAVVAFVVAVGVIATIRQRDFLEAHEGDEAWAVG